MGDLSPEEMEQLVLGYEELDPPDRAVADSYLDRHPELAARLAWHRQQEALAQEPLADIPDLQSGEYLDPRDEKAQQESLRRILAELERRRRSAKPGSSAAAGIAGPTEHLRRHARWALPLAAVLALAVFMPRDSDKQAWVRDLTVVRIEILDDDSRGPDRPAPAAGTLHTGQAFALDFYLDEDAYVVVYHVGPAGQVSRVYPEKMELTLARHPGGHRYRIPTPDSGETWILGAETGTESFLIATSAGFPRDLDRIEVDPAVIGRDRILADLKAQLEQVVDQVDLREFEHID